MTIDETSRMDVILLGKNLGTASGWDMMDTLSLVFYDFIPLKGVEIVSGHITFDLNTGRFERHTDEGELEFSGDLVLAVKDL